MKIDYFKGKKVTIMGLGLLGRGIGDAEYIASSGAKEVIVTDLKPKEELKEGVAALEKFENVKFVLGEHRLEDFNNVDLVLVAAGVPIDSIYLAEARKAGIKLVQSAALFAQLSKVPIIGVTGTRGKSTVTHMIHHVLSVTTEGTVLLGGNVRRVSNLKLLNDVVEDSLCVMELDSWQLQGFGWAKISPQVSVFTNFMEDHLNYYESGGKTKEEAMPLYFNDKAQIFLHQEDSGTFVTTPEVFAMIATYLPHTTLGQEIILADVSVLPEDMLLSMPGDHNRLNAALAYEALKASGLTEEEIFTGLASFPGIEGRLQLIRNLDGVKIYNDNNATTPQAASVALKTLGKESDPNILLISGGADKNIDCTDLAQLITKYCRQAILIPGKGTDKLVDKLATLGYENYLLVDNLTMAVEEARLLAVAPDIILFSPAFASFSQYKNEYERNDEFIKLINAYE